MNDAITLKTAPIEARPAGLADISMPWKFSAAAAVYLLLCLFVQWRTNAAEAAFGSYPDEPAHYIGGLLIRDYAASGLSQSPMSFSQTYHDFIPYFAIGYWPPLFYCVEGAWILLFGPQRWVVLLLSALFAAGSALLILSAIRREAGWLAGFCGGILFLAIPEVQRQVCTTMVDLPVTVGVLGATVFAARYLASGRWKDSIGFAFLAAAACLTKYSAAYICVVPFLGIVALKRWRLLRSATFWAQPAIVFLVVSPWVFLTARFAQVGLPASQHELLVKRLALITRALVFSLPWPLWLVIAVGMAAWIFRPARWRETGITFLVHVGALVLFLAANPVSPERRYFTPAAAAALVAGLSGFQWLKARFPEYLQAGLISCTILTLAMGATVHLRLQANSMRAAVDKVLAEKRWHNAPILVAGDMEGPMIAEFAMRDPHRPGYRLIRPGKVLATDDWFGGNYRSLCQTAEEVQSILTNLHLRVVILRSIPNPKASRHEVLLREAVAGRPELWRAAGIGNPASGSKFEVFEALPALTGDTTFSEACDPGAKAIRPLLPPRQPLFPSPPRRHKIQAVRGGLYESATGPRNPFAKAENSLLKLIDILADSILWARTITSRI